MKARFLLGATLLLSAALGARPAQAQQQSNVIIYIGDGFGLAPKTAARMALGQGRDGKRFASDPGFQVLNLDKFKYNATVTTHSLNSWITDSAPGASVYACGKRGKQDNEVISLDPASGESIETILEAAKKQGYAVGLVSTARITHATPAAFASHIWYRDLEDYIAAQYLAATQAQYEAFYNSSPLPASRYSATRDWVLPAPKTGVELDVILGGGARHFLPRPSAAGTTPEIGASSYEIVKDAAGNEIKDAGGRTVRLGGRRADGIDLVKQAVDTRGYSYVNSRDALQKIDLSKFGPGGQKLLGLFNASHASFEQDRQTAAPWEPSLADMTKAAIDVLKAKSGTKGFFLIVESGRIDHLEHANTGGITVVVGATGNEYTVDADRPTYAGDGEATYTATPATPRTTTYGSDYMIKEVVAFDYAVAEGRALLADAGSGRTLLMTTSDHECGGFALTGLHDEADAQRNGTKIRTYAGQVGKANAAERSYATPTGLTRGDGGAGGWFPEYVMADFQGRSYPQPASATARRIVVAYGSNPITNGNGNKSGGTPGNHTPQDIWVGSDDNTGGSHAGRISGRGLLDNTSLTPIMADFLGLNSFVLSVRPAAAEPGIGLQLSPVPFESTFQVAFELPTAATVRVELFSEAGQRVRTVVRGQDYRAGSHTVAVDGAGLPSGLYVAAVTVNGQVVSRKTLKL